LVRGPSSSVHIQRDGDPIGKAALALDHLLSANSSASAAIGDGMIGIGIDVEEVRDFASKDSSFLHRNFTEDELHYCNSSPDRAASLAGRWCAKEAVIKALSSYARHDAKKRLFSSDSASLRDIEIIPTPSGAPGVRLSGLPRMVADEFHISSDDIIVTISHTTDHAVAQAIARS